MVHYEYRCKDCLRGFLTHINYIIDPSNGKIEVRAANTCKISDGATDFIKPEDYSIIDIKETKQQTLLDPW